MQTDRPSSIWLWLPLIAGFITPSLIIFIMDVALGKRPITAAVSELARRQFAEGENLFSLALFGLIPFALLALILFLVRRGAHRRRVPALSIAGTIGALAFMIPSHVGVWLPLYTNEHMSSTAVIAFVFIPFICCVTMLVGLLVGALASRRIAAQTA